MSGTDIVCVICGVPGATYLGEMGGLRSKYEWEVEWRFETKGSASHASLGTGRGEVMV